MRFYGSPKYVAGGYEWARTLEWLLPVVLTAAVTYGASWIAALTERGGWRAILASVLVVAGRAAYQWAADNSKERA